MVMNMKQYFHGGKKKAPYFEGWYFKCVGRNGEAIAMIPAYHVGQNGEKSASLQVITHERTWFLECPASVFSAEKKTLDIRAGENRFTESGITLNLEQADLSIRGHIAFGPFYKLRRDIMGPFRWMPGMECYHSVFSMGHTLMGKLEVNGEIWNFDGGRGYLEGDRGRAFPAAYLWTQCNWQGSSLMLSVAQIPLGKFRFNGCICAVVHEGKEYRLATYDGGKVASWDPQGAVLRQGNARLQVQLLKPAALPLRAPCGGKMQRTVHESLCTTVRYRFWLGDTLIFDHVDDCAGFEQAGEIMPGM